MTCLKQRRPVVRLFVRSIVVILVSMPAACHTAKPAATAPASRIDRLINAYPELRAGRFALIADFEDEHHLELFHVNHASDVARIELTEAKRRAADGDRALRFHAGSEADELVISNEHAANWYLKRDWRGFDLLLLAVEAPRSDINLQIEILAGPTGHVSRAQADWPLRDGHNVVRLDLAELGEQVPLDDIRELNLRLTGLRRPIDVTFDDLILTQDRAAIVGEASATDGSLFVSRVGQRWHVGAGGRFEIVFANGQIVAWYELTNDPQRLHNLVRGTALGPEVVFENEKESELNEPPIASVSVRTELVEANAVRTVIDVERRTSDSEYGEGRWRELVRWRYTIYPTGQIFVGVETASAARQSARPFSLTVSVRDVDDQAIHMLSTPAPNGSDSGGRPIGVAAKPRESGASLLFVPYFGDVHLSFETRSNVNGMVTFVAAPTGDHLDARDRTCASAYLWLAASATLTDAVAAREAAWFRSPTPLTLLIGDTSTGDGPCLFAEAGFVRARGAYLVEPDRNLVRWRPPATSSDAARAYEVRDVGGRTAWVYVGPQLHEPTVPTPDGGVVFQLPAGTNDAATVEVLLANP